MADEIQGDAPSGLTAYARISLGSNGSMFWNKDTQAVESYSAGNIAHYAVPVTELGASGRYVGNFPALPAGVYSVVIYAQATGSPLESDVAMSEGDIEWDGTQVIAFSNIGNVILDTDDGVEGNISLRQALRAMFAVLACETVGAGTSTISFRDPTDTKNRVTATISAQNNRLSVTYNLD